MQNFFDCHCDTVTTAMSRGQDLLSNSLHIDLNTLRKFDCACQFFAVWLSDEQIKNAYQNTDAALDFFDSQISSVPFAKKVSAGSQIERGRVNAFASIEGGEAIEGSLEKLRHFCDRGVRLMTLTWNRQNHIGSGALSGSSDGLTDFGKQTVREMNRLGMIVDVSHLNEKGFYDVCSLAQAPFMATHSNAYSLCGNPRNLKDDQIKKIADFGGVIGLNLYPPFVCENGVCCADDVVRHADYLLNKAGEDRVVLGCDFDGIDITPVDIQGVSQIHILYDKLCKQFGSTVADKIFFDNMRDFVAKNMQ